MSMVAVRLVVYTVYLGHTAGDVRHTAVPFGVVGDHVKKRYGITDRR